MRRVEKIRRELDQPALTTDVIVGFPGETERDFEETLRVCNAVGFSKIHIFPFSPRRGTLAASMTMAISPGVMRERKSRLQVLESQLAARYYRSLVGRSLQVLVERPDGDQGEGSQGTACRYVPVRFTAHARDEYQLVTVRIVEARETYVVGRRELPQVAGVARRGWSLPIVDLLQTCE
jgi:threonylcarbamoyladenosine tRNA methylthiotransferase MtaB